MLPWLPLRTRMLAFEHRLRFLLLRLLGLWPSHHRALDYGPNHPYIPIVIMGLFHRFFTRTKFPH